MLTAARLANAGGKWRREGWGWGRGGGLVKVSELKSRAAAWIYKDY